MNIINIHEVAPTSKITSFADTAMMLNLLYHPLVEELQEAFTDFTDFDIIEEIVNTLSLPLTCVVEQTRTGLLVYGYMGDVVA